MAQRKRRHHSSGAAAGLTGPATGSTLHSVQNVDTHPPVSHDGGSIWNRRRVLLLNSTYEPLTALPVRRAIIMLICG
ncbi:MAG TPA: HNH endonuclease, partial [Mycobacterium sp.]